MILSGLNRIWILALLTIFFGTKSFAQEIPTPISIQCADQPLNEVLAQIRDEFQVRFAFDAGALAFEKVTVNIQNEDVEIALLKILEPTNFGFRKVGSTYVIVPIIKAPTIKSDSIKTVIHGAVMDKETGEPLPFANIRMKYPSGYFQCDAQGEFSIPYPIADSTVFLFYYVGFEEKSIPAAKLRREKKPVILLGVKNTFLPTAEVVAKAISPIQSMQDAGLMMINPAQVGTVNGPAEEDVLRSAQLLPGVNGTNESSNGLIIRGSGGDQSLLTIDGFTIYHMDHLFGVTSAINPLAVKNIRIAKGPTPAYQATRVGGSAEITAKEGNRYEAGGALEVGPISAGLYLESPIGNGNKASWMIAARRSISDLWASPGYKELFNTVYNASILVDDASSATQSSDYNFSDAISKITFRPNDKNYLYVSGYYSQDHLAINYSSLGSLANYQYNYSDDSNWGNRGVGAGWKRRWNENLAHEFTVGTSRYASGLNAVDTLIDVRFQDVQRLYRQQDNTLDDFTSNLKFIYEKNDWKLQTGAYSNAIKVTSASLNDLEEKRNTQSGLTNAIFGNIGSSKNALSWNAGIRLTHFSPTSQIIPEWRFLANYESSDSIVFKASVGRVNQYVHRIRQQSLFLNQPDSWMISDGKNIPVLKSDQVILGALVPREKVTFDFEGYWKSLSGVAFDLSQYRWLSNSDTVNIAMGTAYALGMDMMIKTSTRRSDMWISYSIAHSRMNLDSIDQLASVPPNFDQLHELKVYYELKWKNWSFWSLWVFGSGRPYTALYGTANMSLIGGNSVQYPVFGDVNGNRISPYHRLDVGCTFKKELDKSKLELRFNVSNVYNRTNIRDYQYVTLLDANGDLQIVTKRIIMNGLIPTVQIKWSF
ncbi:MAG: TonB-dependent receptor [Flavobacteriales bacterium]